MAKNKDLVLDDYIEDDYDYEIDYEYGKDNSDFIEEYDEEKYANYEAKSEKEKVENKSSSNNSKTIYIGEVGSTIVTTLSSVSNLFSIVGIIIAIVLILVFIFTLQLKSLVVYILTLVISFLFGYGFMYLLDYFTSNN